MPFIAAEADWPEMIGETISHYKILDKLGGGGMGVVYRALDLKLDRFVAIKFLSTQLSTHESAKTRFMAEAKAASALDHPNIAVVHEIDEVAGGGMFIVMGYYEGESLGELTLRGSLPVEDVVAITIQAALGLEKAHANGIVHRDIKPDNLILTKDGVVKIVDFGLAKIENLDLTEAGTTVGTPRFMSPEQANVNAADHRTDIWSLGVVLYHLLTGKLPFDGETTSELFENIMSQELPPMNLASNAAAELERIVRKALMKDFNARYQSMSELIEDLRAIKPNLPKDSLMDTPVRSLLTPAPDSRRKDSQSRQDDSLHPSGERRQVTVMACGLAGYDALSEKLDPEELREVLIAFRETCRDVVERYDGRIERHFDERTRVFFGYPRAHEDDARRAVNAGLDLVTAMEKVTESLRQEIVLLRESPLAVAVGIHTGQVVTGQTSGEHEADSTPMGNASTVAMKTQTAAKANQILMTADTEPLIRGFYEVEDLGPTTLPGVTKPLALHRVLRRTGASSRIDIVSSRGLLQMVGRQQELGVLVERWERVREGTGQVVVVSGEAGIGKSHLIETLKVRVGSEPATRLACRCSPYHSNTTLYPIITLTEALMELEPRDSAEQKLAKLKKGLDRYHLSGTEELTLFATLLSVPLPPDHPPVKITAEQQRQRTLAYVLKLFLELAAHKPLMLLVEDLHWVDPSTEELLSYLVDQGPTVPVLTLLTCRPSFQSPWANRADVTHIGLSRLRRTESESLIAQLTRGKSLPVEVLEQVLTNTDGVPLFVEELTKMLLESDLLQEGKESYELKDELSSLAIPATLKDSLMARLDRLGSAKVLAQLASVFGRRFSYEWMEAIWETGPDGLQRELGQLVEAELLYQQGVPPIATYTFKHALVKDAAYQSLLKKTRQQYHEKIASVLADQFPEIQQSQPELLAHHLTEAGLVGEAIQHWARAGKMAFARSANRETIGLVKKALQLLARLPENTDRDQQEMALLGLLAPAIARTSAGYAGAELEPTYARFRTLCERLGQTIPLFWALCGLWGIHIMRAELDQAKELVDQLRELTASLDTHAKLFAHYANGVNAFYAGELEESRSALEAGVSLDGDDGDRFIINAQDTGVTARSNLSLTLSVLGYLELALAHAKRAHALAKEGKLPFSQAYALYHLVWLSLHREEWSEAQAYAHDLIAISEEYGFFWRGPGQILLGRAELGSTPHRLDSTGDERRAAIQSIERMQTALESHLATRSRLAQTSFLALIVESHAALGQWDEAEAHLERAWAALRDTGACFWEAELERLGGELALGRGASPDAAAEADAERSFQRALELSRTQNAKLLELRAALSLSRLWERQEKPREARRILKEVYDSFPEALETPALEAAATRIRELS